MAKEDVIGQPKVDVKDGILTPEILWSFGRLADVSLSFDKKTILYGITYYDISKNKGNTDLYTMSIDGKDVKRITSTNASEWNATWLKDDKTIAFCYADTTGVQIYTMDADGKNRQKVSDIKDGEVEAFSFSPDGKKILVIKAVPKKDKYAYLKEGLDKTTGRINDDLAYRHWDNWVDNIPQPFIGDFNGKEITNLENLLEGTEFESPMRPWGGIEQLCWSPDGKTIAYTCKKKIGKDYAFSTNSDIYLYDIISKKTTNLTEGMMGYDQNPVFSNDGKLLAWESMERDGYEADKIRLMVMDMQSKQIKYLTKDFDQNVSNLSFTKDDNGIYFISDYHGRDNIYLLNLKNDSIKQITQGIHDYTSIIEVDENFLLGSRMSMSYPNELFLVNVTNGEQTNISNINTDLLKKLNLGKVEERWFKATDGKDLQSWIIFPPNFDSTKVYPTLLYCEGGPQSTVSQFWSYRWNFQIMAANGYIIVAPNRRGLPGFGQKWNEQISGDYGGQCMKDYLTAIDDMAKMPYVDKDRLGAVGASFGGFSVYWLAGHHNKRFKCFIAHNGMFNLDQQYLETEEMWFVNWDLGGAYWDKNPIAQRSYANSPHRFVDKWDTPLLVIHSERDYRIVASQGMAAYNAAVIRGIPARYLYFPDETHWVLKPQNGILWQRNFFDWLDKWLKEKK
ncbi:MAG: S9 family peptidase [Bacteroidales bacterium]|jgi:dipeptidyl aminopeptidase/acylaminoacyl peptidase|nr:S9 family peptidase [Bacteroidales bacterium]